jgi:hypothetical protein
MPLEPDQEAVGQHHRDGKAVQTGPQSALVLVSPQLSLGLLRELLDGMTAMGIAGQLLQGGRSRQVARVVFPLIQLPLRASFPKWLEPLRAKALRLAHFP